MARRAPAAALPEIAAHLQQLDHSTVASISSSIAAAAPVSSLSSGSASVGSSGDGSSGAGSATIVAGGAVGFKRSFRPRIRACNFAAAKSVSSLSMPGVMPQEKAATNCSALSIPLKARLAQARNSFLVMTSGLPCGGGADHAGGGGADHAGSAFPARRAPRHR